MIAASEPALRVQDLRKTYEIWSGGWARIAALLGLSRRAKQVHALDGVSFQVMPGEAIGIIGRNGSGKSTLLKILSGLGIQSSGELTVRGRVQALLELGTGFLPDFTGRENLYFSAMLFGLSRREVDAIYDEIVDFAELRSVIDQPLRTYSSGMKMRLAFSAAASLSPDLLLLDEVLAVGDSFFQMRCLERMQGFVERGGTLMLVSHDLTSILRMCPRTLWIDRGKLVADGDSTSVIRAYRTSIVEQEEKRLEAASSRAEKANASFILDRLKGSKEAELEGVKFYDREGKASSVFRTGARLEARIRFRVHSAVPRLIVSFTMYRSDGVVTTQAISELDGAATRAFEPGQYTASVVFDPLLIGPGDYVVSTGLLPEVDPRDRGALKIYDVRSKTDALNIELDPERAIERGIVHHPVRWTIEVGE